MNLIRWEEIDPRIAKVGWNPAARRRAIARLTAESILGAACLIGALVVAYFAVVILAAYLNVPLR